MRNGEITLNDHVKMWCKGFYIGGATNARRCARALASHYVMIPVLQGLRKDHKANRNGDPNLGPKLRPLCAANKAPSAAFGGVVAKTVKAIADNVVKEGKGEVISTEEMKRLIEDSNKTRQRKPIQNNKLSIFSMDVTALYPSITSEMASRAAKDSIRTSNLIWKNISTKHLIRYVAICCDRDEIVRDKLGEVIPIAKPRTTLHSLSNPSKRARELDGKNQFDPPMRHPTPRERTKIIGHAISAGIRACMDHH